MSRFRPTSLALAALVASAWAAPPSPLPAGWILFDSNRCTTPVTGVCKSTKNYEIYAQDPSGNVQAITTSAAHDSWWPKLSPDRTKILFYRTDAGLKESDGFTRTSLWWVPVNMAISPVRLIPASKGIEAAAPHPYGWLAHAHAEWSPLQNAITMMALENVVAPTFQIYVTPFVNGTNTIVPPYRVSSGASDIKRPGQNIDPTFTPDGAGIMFIGCPNADGNATCDAGNSQELILTANVPSASFVSDSAITTTAPPTVNFDPYYNTDGGQIAWLHTVNCTRWGVRHGTHTGGVMAATQVINDGAVNSKPGWINSNTFYFHRWPTIASTVWYVNASTWSGGLLEPSVPLEANCQNDGITQATGSTTVAPDPTGLSTATVLFSSSRCGNPTSCPTPSSWKIYRWTLGTVNPTPFPIESPSSGNDFYEARVSPNRKWILYMKSGPGMKGNPHAQSLWVMNSAGGGATQLIASGDDSIPNPFGWKTLGGASWSADGTKIVLSAANATQLTNQSPQIYRVSFSATPTPSVSGAVKLSNGSGSADRPGKNVSPSYSPDGTRIVFSGCPLNAGRTACLSTTRSPAEVVTIASAGGSAGELILTNTAMSTNGAVEYRNPNYNPQGTQIAAVRTINCSATEIVKLNASTGALVGTALPGAVHFGPQWSYDGTTLFFGALPNNFRSTNWKIDANPPGSGAPGADGTNLVEVTGTTPCGSEYPNAD